MADAFDADEFAANAFVASAFAFVNIGDTSHPSHVGPGYVDDWDEVPFGSQARPKP